MNTQKYYLISLAAIILIFGVAYPINNAIGQIPTYTLTINSVNAYTQYMVTATPSPSSSNTYAAGTVVTLSALPTYGALTFAGWNGPVESTSSPTTTVTMNANQTVTANYTIGQGTTYYVSSTGDVNFNSPNSSAGNGSLSNPFVMIQNALPVLGPGDTLLIEPGTYVGFIAGWDNNLAYQNDRWGIISGVQGAPITIEADPNPVSHGFPNGAVIINEQNNKTAKGIDLEPDDNYITIEGITVEENSTKSITKAGISVSGGPSDNNVGSQILNNTVNGVTGFGIFSGFTTGQLIQGNTVTGTLGTGDIGHGIYISNGAANPVVQNNILVNNQTHGLQMNGDISECSGGIVSATCSGTVSGALVQNNLLINNSDNGFNFDGVVNSTIQNNVIYSTLSSTGNGIVLFQIDGATGSSGNVIANNTIYTPSSSGLALRILDGAPEDGQAATPSSNNTVFNNILIAAGGTLEIGRNSLSSLKMDYNIESNTTSDTIEIDNVGYDTFPQWQASGQDTHSIMAPSSATTLFTNPTGTTPNMSLVSGSSAIGHGTAAFNKAFVSAVDFAGTIRPQGISSYSYDIGAYEFPFPGSTITNYNLTANTSNGGYVVQTMPNGDPSSSPYNSGTSVTLNAIPTLEEWQVSAWTQTYQFNSWSGAVTGSKNPANVTTSANQAVTANFGLAGTGSTTPTPTVSLTTDNTSYTAPATIILTSVASEINGTITGVVFNENNSLITGTVQSNSPTYTMTLSSIPVGTFTFTATATDTKGISVTSAPVTVTVNAAPVALTISITSPANNKTFTTLANGLVNINITAEAEDTGGTISNVAFYSNNSTTPIGTATAQPYKITWNNVLPGNYNLTAVVTDKTTGAKANSSPVAISVIGLPKVSLTAIVNDPTSSTAASINMTAIASETNGTISEVLFYRGGSTLLGTGKLIAPKTYSFTWSNNVTTGTHHLTAKAKDSNGHEVTSATVVATVKGQSKR